jgi:hypothetical protein
VRSRSAPPTGTSPSTGLAIRRKTQPIGWATDAAFGLDCDHRFMDEARVVDLAERHSQDVDVVLWWGMRSSRLWVLVTDRYSGRSDRIHATAWNALDVFQHPPTSASPPDACHARTGGWMGRCVSLQRRRKEVQMKCQRTNRLGSMIATAVNALALVSVARMIGPSRIRSVAALATEGDLTRLRRGRPRR